jgi:hypothetical protein
LWVALERAHVLPSAPGRLVIVQEERPKDVGAEADRAVEGQQAIRSSSVSKNAMASSKLASARSGS